MKLMMVEAWNKGVCSPYEFRKCLSEDLNFIDSLNKCVKEKSKKKKEEEEHNRRIEMAMQSIKNG